MRVLLSVFAAVLLVDQANGFNILPSRPLQQQQLSRAWASSALIAVTTMTSFAPYGTASEWNFMNGSVKLPNPLQFVFPATNEGAVPTRVTLVDPVSIGAGGGGAVFAFRDSSTLVKVSWTDSTKSVRRECQTLQTLQTANILAAERCLGEFPYQDENEEENEGRIMIVVEPYVRNAVSSVEEIVDTTKQVDAVQQIARTLVQMLAASIVTIDVQPLIDSQTGQVIFIDMTEAQTLQPPYSFLDQTLMGSFATEMLTLIPQQHTETARQVLVKEIRALESKGMSLSDEAKEILYSQTRFFADDEG